MKTSELTGPALDWAVELAKGTHGSVNGYFVYNDGKVVGGVYPFSSMPEHPYSTDWAQGGPIIERELMSPEPLLDDSCALVEWTCRNWRGDGTDFCGPTPLIAAMRCSVASKLGDEVDVPEELIS